MRRRYLFASLLLIATALAARLSPPNCMLPSGSRRPRKLRLAPASQSLTLQQAEQIALQNHPQIQAAQVSGGGGEGAGHAKRAPPIIPRPTAASPAWKRKTTAASPPAR